jgi:hypothetical protein
VPVTRTVGGSWTDIRDCPILRKPTGGCPEGTFLDGLSAPVPRTDHPAVCLVRRTGNWLAAVVVAGAERARSARYITVLDSVLAVYLAHDGLRRGVARPVGGVGHTDRFLVTTPVDNRGRGRAQSETTAAPSPSTTHRALRPVRIPARVSLQLREDRGRVFGPPETPSRPGSVVPQVWDSGAWPQSTTRPHRPNFLQRTALAHAHL